MIMILMISKLVSQIESRVALWIIFKMFFFMGVHVHFLMGVCDRSDRSSKNYRESNQSKAVSHRLNAKSSDSGGITSSEQRTISEIFFII
jgi:hypothetical protein